MQRGLGQIDQRMTDELDRDTALAIDGFLEREDHQHAIGERADRSRARWAATPKSAG